MEWSNVVPPIEERRKPGLSTTLTTYARTPVNCQSCGFTMTHTELPTPTGKRWLQRWIEHDPDDRKTDVIVVLCNVCGDRLIGLHARLYTPLRPNQQFVGTHATTCMGCRWRDGLTCNSPLRRARGGPGLRMTQGEPTRGIVCGSNKSGRFSRRIVMDNLVTGCPGLEAVATELAL